MTKDGLRKPNYFGSLTHAATVRVGNYKGEEIHVPFSSLLPMVHPNDFVLGGWDISGARAALERLLWLGRLGARLRPSAIDGCTGQQRGSTRWRTAGAQRCLRHPASHLPLPPDMLLTLPPPPARRRVQA